jgi:type III secretion protein U
MAEKTQKPTAKKLRDARKKGQVPKSKEVSSTAVLCALVIAAWAGSSFFMDNFLTLARLAFNFNGVTDDPNKMLLVFESAAKIGILILLIIAVIELVTVVLAGVIQTRGFVFSMDPILPKFEKLNPGQNFKKLFSLKQVYEVIRKLLVIAVFIALLAWLFKVILGPSIRLIYTPHLLVNKIGYDLMLLFSFSILVVIVAAAVDFGLQIFEFMKDQRMSIEDIRREHKDSEGDPYIKSHRRALMRQMATEITGAAKAKRANVIVTNPTHVAVALFYEPGGDPPKVIAKGLDQEALEIRESARGAGVPILEDPPLARRLFRMVAVDDIIQNELFEAVAAVLAWAEKVAAEKKSKGDMSSVALDGRLNG